MPKKTVAVKKVAAECVWCDKIFDVEIDAKYDWADALPQGVDIAGDEGEYLRCPKCSRGLFIKYGKGFLL
jgi:hypothetical protein